MVIAAFGNNPLAAAKIWSSDSSVATPLVGSAVV